jgi:ferritin-like protein
VTATFGLLAIETVPTGCRDGGNSTTMTKEELIEAACEVIGGNVKDLSVDQVQKLMTITQHLTDLSLKEHRSFGNLCTIRATIDAAVTAGRTMDDLVTVCLTKEQCAFLLALLDEEIREHA